MCKKFLVKFRRLDQPAVKVMPFEARTSAIDVANSIAMVLWGRHAFKRSACRGQHAISEGNFEIEYLEECTT